MPRLRQIDGVRSVCMVQVGIPHYTVAEPINVSKITISRLMIRLKQVGRMTDPLTVTPGRV